MMAIDIIIQWFLVPMERIPYKLVIELCMIFNEALCIAL